MLIHLLSQTQSICLVLTIKQAKGEGTLQKEAISLNLGLHYLERVLEGLNKKTKRVHSLSIIIDDICFKGLHRKELQNKNHYECKYQIGKYIMTVLSLVNLLNGLGITNDSIGNMPISITYQQSTKENFKDIKFIILFYNICIFKNIVQMSGTSYEGTHHPQDYYADEYANENSFENGNEIFELRSQINCLKIEREKLGMEHQKAIKTIEAKNQLVENQNRQLKKQRNELKSINKTIQDKISEQETYILQLTHNLQKLENHPKPGQTQLSDCHQDQHNQQKIFEETLECANLKDQINQLKAKQISYKRQYEGMLQTKQQIIRKLSNQNDESIKRINESRDKIINELKKQLEENVKKVETYKSEAKSLKEQLMRTEEHLDGIRNQYKMKEERIIENYREEKEEFVKEANHELSTKLQENQIKLKKTERKLTDLTNQLIDYKQQNGKYRVDIASLQQFNSYLQTSNSEYELGKKKLQEELYSREKQIGEMKETHFYEISELKKEIFSQRIQMNQKISFMQNEINEKNIIILQYQEKAKESLKAEEKYQEYLHTHQTIKSKMNQEIQQLREILRQKDTFLAQKEDTRKNVDTIREQYQQVIKKLEEQLADEKCEQKSSYKYSDIDCTQLKRLKLELEKCEAENERKKREISKLKNKISLVQQEMENMEKKGAEYLNGWKNSKIQCEQLERKYENLVQKNKKEGFQMRDKTDDMNRQMQKLRKALQKYKSQINELENQYDRQSKQNKMKRNQLEDKLDEMSSKKIQDNRIAQKKIDNILQQMQTISKEKELLIQTQTNQIKNLEDTYQAQKHKILEYVEQLQENKQILGSKCDQLQAKRKQNQANFEEQVKQIKVQYSELLTEMNLVLQKYRKLQEIHIKSLAEIDCLKESYQCVHQKNLDIMREKNKILDQLNGSYEQINKLNSMLVSKQQSSNRNKIINCPHFQQRGNKRTNSYYSPNN